VGNVQKLKHDIETATWQDASEMKMEGSADSGKEHTQKKSLLISKRDEHGWQPIHEGAFGGHLDVVQLLVRNGADINTRTHGGHGGTPLHLAHKKFGDHHPIVKYLKSIGGLNVGPHTEL
jgi:ankyrin repeat protein